MLNKHVFEYGFLTVTQNKLTSKQKRELKEAMHISSSEKKKKALLESAIWFFKAAKESFIFIILRILFTTVLFIWMADGS